MANTKITNPELFNLGDSTSATQLPVMTTTQRIAMNAAPTLNVDYLVVAGGGGGGAGYTASTVGTGGGGGSGGLLSGSALSLTSGAQYNVTVGSGGTGAGPGYISTKGGDSTFNTITSSGGGGGGSYNYANTNHQNGGSGGGAGYGVGFGTGIAGQGNDGGSFNNVPEYGCAGGGGAGAVGESFISGTAAGDGGIGLQSNITGASVYYAGGGGGGMPGNYTPGSGGNGGGGDGGSSISLNGNNGVANTGGGGGGAGHPYASGNNSGIGGSGGFGVVIIRYATADVQGYTSTGITPTETTDGTDTILSFTTVGTGTITFTSSTPTGTISTGEMIFNSTTDKVEYWDGTKWYGITYEVDSVLNTVLYDGQNTNLSVTGVGFTPDLVWVKCRDVTSNHTLSDSVRGGNGTTLYSIFSNLTNSESSSNQIQTIDTDGFTVFGNRSATNRANQEYVAWCFKAGGAPSGSDKVSIDGTSYSTMSAAGLTDGNRAINKLSVNTKLGFSIATIDNKILNNGSNIAHGLGVQPELILAKQTDQATDWIVFSKTEGGNRYLVLNSNAASADDTYWGDANPTSTLINFNWTNAAQDYVFYSFASKIGVSKVGSYQGNGLTTGGPVINSGFKPSWIMIKSTSFSERWVIYDNKRSTSNPRSKVLTANSDATEINTLYYDINFTDTGFTVNGTAAFTNRSGEWYTYLAFA